LFLTAGSYLSPCAFEDSFEIDGEEIGVVTSFTFLGSEMEKEGGCDKEIK